MESGEREEPQWVCILITPHALLYFDRLYIVSMLDMVTIEY